MVAVDNLAWEPVVVPINCKTIIFSNNEATAQDVYRRIDSANADTQCTIPVGMQATWVKSDTGHGTSMGLKYFWLGTTIAHLKSVAGSFNVAVEFIE